MNYLHAGYGKAASSFLQKHYFTEDNGFLNLSRYPEWDSYLQDGLTTAHSLYFPTKSRPQLPDNAGSRSLMIGASDEIFLSDGVDYRIKLERWKEMFPESKVLIITRNQLDIVFSGYRTWIRDGYFRSLESYIREMIWDMQASTLGWLFFDRAYEITKEYFDEVHMFPYERISNFKSFLNEINEFFGVDVQLKNDSVNISSNDTVVKVLRILNYFLRYGKGRPYMTLLPSYMHGPTRFKSNNVPGKVPSPRFRKVVNKLAVRVGSRFPSKVSGREEFFNKYERLFEDIFGESNRRVESLLGEDLGKYGYVGTTAKTTVVD